MFLWWSRLRIGIRWGLIGASKNEEKAVIIILCLLAFSQVPIAHFRIAKKQTHVVLKHSITVRHGPRGAIQLTCQIQRIPRPRAQIRSERELVHRMTHVELLELFVEHFQNAIQPYKSPQHFVQRYCFVIVSLFCVLWRRETSIIYL